MLGALDSFGLLVVFLGHHPGIRRLGLDGCFVIRCEQVVLGHG